MRQKYGIGFLIVLCIMLVGVSVVYDFSYRSAKKREEIRVESEAAKAESASKEQAVVEAKGQAHEEDGYYLAEKNGYVVVYLSDKKTIYEYTDILCQDLPEHVQIEIKNGKPIENTKVLYGFLENYSS